MYLVLAIIAPIVPMSPYEERRGCCYVKGSPPKKGESATRSVGSRSQEKAASRGESDVEAMEDFESAAGDSTEDDERTTNTNNEGATTVAEEDDAEKEEGGLCGNGSFFDNICGKNEEGTEVTPVKKDGEE